MPLAQEPVAAAGQQPFSVSTAIGNYSALLYVNCSWLLPAQYTLYHQSNSSSCFLGKQAAAEIGSAGVAWLLPSQNAEALPPPPSQTTSHSRKRGNRQAAVAPQSGAPSSRTQARRSTVPIRGLSCDGRPVSSANHGPGPGCRVGQDRRLMIPQIAGRGKPGRYAACPGMLALLGRMSSRGRRYRPASRPGRKRSRRVY